MSEKETIPDKLKDDYQIIGEAGTGGNGKCYILTEKENPTKLYCLKTQYVKAAEIEEKKINSIPLSPDIIKYENVEAKDSRSSWVLLDFIPGVTIQKLVEYLVKNELDFHDYQILAVFYTISYVLKSLGGLKHRDIKPDNIIIDSNFVAHLIDFGEMKTKKTDETGRFHGEIHFTAPEAEDLIYTPESDIYSLGLVLYYMLFKKKPFEKFKDDKELRNCKRSEKSFIRTHNLIFPPKDPYICTLLKQVDGMEKFGTDYNPLKPTIRDELINIIILCTKKEKENRPKPAKLCESIREIAMKHLSPRKFDKFRLICLYAENSKYGEGPYGTKELTLSCINKGFITPESTLAGYVDNFKEILNLGSEVNDPADAKKAFDKLFCHMKI